MVTDFGCDSFVVALEDREFTCLESMKTAFQ